MAALIPDEKCLVLVCKESFFEVNDAASYHPRQVAPSAADGTLNPTTATHKG